MEARRVARLAGRPADVVAYRDVALLALLTKDPEQARTFVHATLGPLAGGEDTSRRLAQTLHVLLQEQGSPRRAGHRLGVHENTVAKRQRAIDRLLDPATRAPVAELLTALTLLEVVAAEPA
jgi:DNA-binding PucR family transcriptional regulator